jgi:hypothetical protein
MINISSARLLPFQAFHSFHEQINVHIKVAHSANLLLVRHAGEPSSQDELADLIASSHPSWNAAPVRNLSIKLQRAQDAGVSAFAIVSVFSAFDDFLIGTEAEVSRGKGNQAATKSPKDEAKESDDDEEKIDRVFRLYGSMGWPVSGIANLQPLLRYFRLCRNCIAHRNGRASKALVTQSSDPALSSALASLQEGPERGIMAFKVNDPIHLPPTLAIMCSHILRLIAIDANDANDRLIETLGLDGVLKMAAHHAVRLNEELGGKARKRPEAILNAFLTQSRVRMDSREESIVEMKRIGAWATYVSEISSGASNRSSDRYK